SAFLGVSLAGVVPGLHPLVMLVPVLVISFGLGYVLQAVLINRIITRPDPFAAILLTFGLAVVMRNLMLEGYGADPRTLTAGTLAQASVPLFGLSVGVLPLLVLGVSVVVVLSVSLVLSLSLLRLSVRLMDV